MKKSYTTIILLFFFSQSSVSQAILFNKAYDYLMHLETGVAVREMDEGYLMAIKTTAHTYELNRIVLFRLDATGDTLWTKAHFIDSTVVFIAAPTIEDAGDGNFVMAGMIRHPRSEEEDGMLMKFTPEGDLIWLKKYGGPDVDGFRSMRKTLDGGYILGGYSHSNNPDGDFYLVKVDSEGEMEWESSLGGQGWQSGYSVDFTADGGYVIAGRGGSPPFNIDIAAAKCDAHGNPLWSKIYGGPNNNDAPHKIKALSDGNIMLSGAFGNGSSQYSQNRDAFLIKLNQNGNVIWQKEYDKEFTTVHVSELLELPDGSLVVTGGDYIGENSPVYGAIHKYDSEGNPLWSRLYAGQNPYANNYLYGIVPTSDGGFLALGSTYDPNLSNRQEAWLLRLDSEGYTCDSVGCVEVVNALPPPQEEEPFTISPNPSTGLLTAQWQQEGPVELKVFTTTGHQAWAYKGASEGPISINLSHLPPGLYLLTLRTEGQLLSRKFMLSD